MKKTLCLLLCAILLCAAFPPVLAEDEEKIVDASGLFQYVVREDGSAELISYLGPDGRIIFPTELDGHPLLAVRLNPFYDGGSSTKSCLAAVAQDHPYLATIQGVLFGKSDKKLIAYPVSLADETYAIPNGIRTVGAYAFANNRALTSVSIPDTVTVIEQRAFVHCSQLVSADLPDGLTGVDTSAFYQCSSLQAVVIPGGVADVGAYAFYKCYGLSSVTLQSGVVTIGYQSFYDCNALTSIAIPEGVVSIGKEAFYHCDSLASVTLPGSLTEIGPNAFAGCSQDLVFEVPLGSEAEAYCMRNGLHYNVDFGIYTDAPTDWLND